ncbi:MAG TPA: heavy metal-binding domain-containing protein [Chthoniobacterales bacterium]|nr:heavy metal-binding domain-containing protein [Chthoniobacterales bacterium]
MKTTTHSIATYLVVFLVTITPLLSAHEGHDHDAEATIPVAGTAAEAWRNAQNCLTAMKPAVAAKQQSVIHDEQQKMAAALKQLQEKTGAAPDQTRFDGAINNAITASDRLHVASDGGDWAKVESALKTLQATMVLLEKQLPADVKATSDSHDSPQHGSGPSGAIRAEIVSPRDFVAGKAAPTTLRLTDDKGQPVPIDALQVAHTEKIHLLIVDAALSDYHHEHPVAGDKPGEYRFEFRPRAGGTYHIWADIVPSATNRQEYAQTTVKVQGPPAKKDNSLNTTAEAGGYRFSLTTPKNAPLETGKAVLASVKITTPDGREFSQLEPVMGAFAHMVGFPESVDSVTHVHPMGREPQSAAERGGPELQFHIQPEKPGFHKFYLQTQIGGKEVYAAFSLDVKQGSGPVASVAQEFTCPMHPDVKDTKPGKCPKCGMSLQPAGAHH